MNWQTANDTLTRMQRLLLAFRRTTPISQHAISVRQHTIRFLLFRCVELRSTIAQLGQ